MTGEYISCPWGHAKSSGQIIPVKAISNLEASQSGDFWPNPFFGHGIGHYLQIVHQSSPIEQPLAHIRRLILQLITMNSAGLDGGRVPVS